MLAMLTPARLHHKAARAWTRDQWPAVDALGPVRGKVSGGKVRIGYFSADFRDHAVAQMSAAVFEHHDRSKFELTAFSFGPGCADAMRQRLQKTFDRFLEVGDRSDSDIAALSRELDIDIAIDLNGFTAHCRPGIFALRAAPIQVNYLGYPGTMGAGYMDYLIADRIVIAPERRCDYTEKIIYLPDTFFPGDPTREIAEETPSREQVGLPSCGFVFCCFNNNYKITPDRFASWMRILGRVEASVLWLSRNNLEAAANLRDAAFRAGIDPMRLIFADRLPSLSDHLARYRAADLFLDTQKLMKTWRFDSLPNPRNSPC
jgi:predicted O-linked N-acetylglucosamine transferase (SPINDLY family)